MSVTINGSGQIVTQVIQTVYTTPVSRTGNNTWANIAGVTASITPTNSANKVLVTVSMTLSCGPGITTHDFRLTRNGTPVGVGVPTGSQIASSYKYCQWSSDSNHGFTVSFSYIDSPSTTSSTPYSVDWYPQNSFTLYLNQNASGGNTVDSYNAFCPAVITLYEISGA